MSTILVVMKHETAQCAQLKRLTGKQLAKNNRERDSLHNGAVEKLRIGVDNVAGSNIEVQAPAIIRAGK
jgi:hypothetical protein